MENCSPLERCTVNRLSYMPVDVCTNPPPKPIVQTYSYIRPTAPIEQCTIQKLSYLPVCLPAKEPKPWAEKHHCPPPKYQNLCTTYNLSYIPNCNPRRIAPIMPLNGLKFFGTDCNDCNTVYKLSYLGNDARCCRPKPVLPMDGLELPTGPMESVRDPLPWARASNYVKPTAPVEKCTIQKLSYGPPGTFSRCGACCNQNRNGNSEYPKAGIC
ncbi:hypothetical protein EVAR_73790_1 [Eumeta japonica]|uniref:Uncharacterized protein n=1 Tax=Eumeta variegata TaxID=151549 RepID=A0A4C1SS21_EUMVA|nr:hypothetical protein EVAR_73790_1 [Eumeta japonica]